MSKVRCVKHIVLSSQGRQRPHWGVSHCLEGRSSIHTIDRVVLRVSEHSLLGLYYRQLAIISGPRFFRLILCQMVLPLLLLMLKCPLHCLRVAKCCPAVIVRVRGRVLSHHGWGLIAREVVHLAIGNGVCLWQEHSVCWHCLLVM